MRKKTVLILMTLCFSLSLVFTFSTSAHAKNEYHKCKVIFAGPSGGKVMIKLYDESTHKEKWCVIYREDDEKEMLAVALTAAANNQTVNAYFNASLDRPLIYSMFIYNRGGQKIIFVMVMKIHVYFD